MHISIRAEQSEVKNQYDRPTCVAFAVSALHEHAFDVLSGFKATAEVDLSERYLHYHCKKRDGLKPNCLGTTMLAASASLGVEGQSLETLCPYQLISPAESLAPPTAAALTDGKTRLLLGLQRLNLSVSSIRNSLGLSRPVIGVFDWYSNAYVAQLGRIEVPRPSDRFLGRHADSSWRSQTSQTDVCATRVADHRHRFGYHDGKLDKGPVAGRRTPGVCPPARQAVELLRLLSHGCGYGQRCGASRLSTKRPNPKAGKPIAHTRAGRVAPSTVKYDMEDEYETSTWRGHAIQGAATLCRLNELIQYLERDVRHSGRGLNF